jgi:hypothetical protein
MAGERSADVFLRHFLHFLSSEVNTEGRSEHHSKVSSKIKLGVHDASYKTNTISAVGDYQFEKMQGNNPQFVEFFSGTGMYLSDFFSCDRDI